MTTLTVPGRTAELVTFHLGDLWIGTDIADAQEIIRLGDCRTVPHAPACVHGVVNLRGEVITVIDPGLVLGTGATMVTDRTRNVIVRSQSERIGLLVDEVGDVVRADSSEIERPPGNVDSTVASFLRGVIRQERGLLCLLDIDAALGGDTAETA